MKIVHPILAMTAAAVLVTASNTFAQQWPPPCVIINGTKCYLDYDACNNVIGVNCPSGSSGTANFKAIKPTDPCAPAGIGDFEQDLAAGSRINAALQPEDINVTVLDAQLGSIKTTLDATRTAENTTIESNGADEDEVYPLTVHIRFYALAELASRPGKTFASQTQLEFESSNVNSVVPFLNETFTLAKDVNYYEFGDNSQTTVFTLQAGSTNLTIDGQEGEEGRDDLLR